MNKKLFISSLLIIFSFFLGYFYRTYEVSKKIEKIENKKYYIDIKQTKKNLKIKNPNPNVVIFLGEKKLQNTEEKILLNK